tara:strand:+ start:488 stop:1051 length:564 start_codon:yes stop_codon:yes gene_type:complete
MADIDITVDPSQATGSKAAPELGEYVFNLDARKTLDGDIVVRDHPDIDIILMMEKGKIVAFPKENLTDEIYLTQDKLFDFLGKKGVVSRESVQGGNLHGSMEADVLGSDDDSNVNNICLMVLAKFIEEEKPYYEYMEKFEKEQEERLTAPSEAESSEFDPTRHAGVKGTLQPIYIRSPYGMSFTYRE